MSKYRRAALPSSLITAAYFSVRLIPRDFGSLAYEHFLPASKRPDFRQSDRKNGLLEFWSGETVFSFYSHALGGIKALAADIHGVFRERLQLFLQGSL